MEKDTVLILSGGMDSTTLLYDFKDRIALALSFDYGSNHNARELAMAAENCRRLDVPHLVIPLDFMGKYFASSLLAGADAIPDGNYDEENMKSTVVPFRNGIMLAIAAGLAESRGLKHVMMANHSGDHTIYPDCRPEFVDAMNEAIRLGTFPGITLLSPYCNLNKGQIAARGAELGMDYSLTYSCYRGGEHHCGTCGTCRERKEAFQQANIKDPTIYEA